MTCFLAVFLFFFFFFLASCENLDALFLYARHVFAFMLLKAAKYYELCRTHGIEENILHILVINCTRFLVIPKLHISKRTTIGSLNSANC